MCIRDSSGIEIDKGRGNANMLMGRLLNHMKQVDFRLAELKGLSLIHIYYAQDETRHFMNYIYHVDRDKIFTDLFAKLAK